MATLTTALRRKNASGGYDTIVLQGDSTITYRPSGRTVEQDLAAYLPSVQSSDVVPNSLPFGRLQTGQQKVWVGNSSNLPMEIMTENNTFSVNQDNVIISEATDYTTNRVRGVALYQDAAPASIPNGCIVGVYTIS